MGVDPDVIEKAKDVALLVMDCDGVLTDGRLYFGLSGEELKVFNVRDGQGIVEWHRAGGRSAIISGRNSPIVARRALELGIEFVFQGVSDKVAKLQELVGVANIGSHQIAFVGDDLPDAEVFPFVGLPIAVADAHRTAIDAAEHVTVARGGRGAIREITDLLIQSRIPVN